MQCPVCSVPLVMTDRSGVEIDYCPQCRGVWLDRGELDKIIERSEAARPANGWNIGAASQEDRHGHDDDEHHREYGPRRKSFWRDIFD